MPFLFLVSSLNLALIVLAYLYALRTEKDLFGPVRLACLFSLIGIFVQYWYALLPGAIERSIFPLLSDEYQRLELLQFHYVFILIASFFTLAGAYLGAHSKAGVIRGIARLGQRVPSLCEKTAYPILTFYYLLGVALFLLMIQKMGGLVNIWLNLHQRVELAAGLNYISSFYSMILFLTAACLYIKLVRQRRLLLAFVTVFTSLVIMGALGQRGPVAVLLFYILMVHNYQVTPFRRLLSFNRVVILFILLVFMVVFVQFRSPEVNDIKDVNLDTLSTQVENQLVRRLGSHERGMVVLGYFMQREFWGLDLYYSVLVAPIPRTLMTDKPPVDTGRYLATIAQGRDVTPPMPVRYLNSSSWPDGLYSGYMSFGLPGYLLLSLLSGLFCGYVYKWSRLLHFSPVSLYFYASVSFLGIASLSPLRIVYLMTDLLFLTLIVASLVIVKSLVPHKKATEVMPAQQ